MNAFNVSHCNVAVVIFLGHFHYVLYDGPPHLDVFSSGVFPRPFNESFHRCKQVFKSMFIFLFDCLCFVLCHCTLFYWTCDSVSLILFRKPTEAIASLPLNSLLSLLSAEVGIVILLRFAHSYH